MSYPLPSYAAIGRNIIRPSPRFDTEWVEPGAKQVSFFLRGVGEPFQYSKPMSALHEITGRVYKTDVDTTGTLKAGQQFYAHRIIVYILNKEDIDLGWIRDGVVELLYHGESLCKAPLDFALVSSRKFPGDISNFGALGLDMTLRGDPYVFDQLALFEVRIDTETPFKTWTGLRCVITGQLMKDIRQ